MQCSKCGHITSMVDCPYCRLSDSDNRDQLVGYEYTSQYVGADMRACVLDPHDGRTYCGDLYPNSGNTIMIGADIPTVETKDDWIKWGLALAVVGAAVAIGASR
jgi:hypothetical protein